MDEAFIREQFRKSGFRVSRTARLLDLDYGSLRALVAPETAPLVGPSDPRPADIRQLGKVGLKHFVIAVKAVTDPAWPADYANTIRLAHAQYDAGTHEMFQETRDGWNILYCQKRKRPDPRRRPWFSRRDFT